MMMDFCPYETSLKYQSYSFDLTKASEIYEELVQRKRDCARHHQKDAQARRAEKEEM